MKVDLHTHTTASDGQLPPAELLGAACDEGVSLLAITDHDTIAGYDALPPRDDLTIVPGIELSTTWCGRSIHIVGLGIDLDDAGLAEAIRRQLQARQRRAEIITDRLAKRGLAIQLDDILAIAGTAAPGRPHFARYLVESGQVRDLRTAFRKYLGAGKAGDVKTLWPELASAVEYIRDAGGVGVLAHPDKYRMTHRKLESLARDFAAAGGRCIEIVCGRFTPAVTAGLAELAGQFGFSVSLGSDFHAPTPWSRPGVEAAVVGQCTPVWDAW
ncbi:MAG: PHP domain-containing protein [Woeseiaceae bacterium]|jgi:predicted metal-dependent phosphoesterase TrpH|nr:PHP domain-containing protein [Woeseiaceae bacterium]